MDTVKKDRWTLFERAFLILPTVLIAVVVWMVTSGAEREKVRLEYVRIASGILQRPVDQANTQRGMREWAVAVLNKSAPIKLSTRQTAALIDGTSTLPVYWTTDYQDYYFATTPTPRPRQH
jgi:hypothetical protein